MASPRWRAMSTPNTSISPALLFTSELTMPMRVDLPAPVGAERGEEVAGAHVEGDALERFHAVVVGLAEGRAREARARCPSRRRRGTSGTFGRRLRGEASSIGGPVWRPSPRCLHTESQPVAITHFPLKLVSRRMLAPTVAAPVLRPRPTASRWISSRASSSRCTSITPTARPPSAAIRWRPSTITRWARARRWTSRSVMSRAARRRRCSRGWRPAAPSTPAGPTGASA
jgi:hypothetical protein